MNTGTLALVIDVSDSENVRLRDVLSDQEDIDVLQEAVESGNADPHRFVLEERKRREQEDEDFGDYVEALLCNPFLRSDVKDHGLKWLKSKVRIEQFRRSEEDAATVIAEFAFKIFENDRSKVDFFLAGRESEVRVRVFALRGQPQEALSLPEGTSADSNNETSRKVA